MTSSLIGFDTQTGQRVEIPKTSRLQGLYVIGIQGTGKSGLIENLIIQDIKQGVGVGLLDPHGDLTQAVLSRLPDRRLGDVIYLDITDYRYPFGINLFECSDLTNPFEVQKTVDQVMHVFEKIYGVSRDTPLILDYLRNCTYTLIANPGYTMAEIPLLLLNGECRKKLVSNVTDIDVHHFWQQYEQMKPSEQNEQASYIRRRVAEFLLPLSRPIVGQAQSTIDVQNIMDEGKILLVKLSIQLPSVTSLIGSIMIALILNAASARPANKRRQFNLYADEFQRFATEDFATLLEEARKYGIATTIAHQNRGQLDTENRQLAANLKDRTRSVANLAVFKINSKDADELAGEFDITPQEAWEEEIEEERVEVVRPQRHERIEEQVEIEIEDDTLEVTQDPVDYLVSMRGTHGSMRVREITQNLLAELKKQDLIKMPVNKLLVWAMEEKIRVKSEEFIDFMQEMAIQFVRNWEDTGPRMRFAKNRDFIRTLVLSPVNWEDIAYWVNSTQDAKREYLRKQVFSPINHENPIHQFIDEEVIWVIKSRPYQGIHHGYHESPQTANLAEMTRKERAVYFATGYIEYGGIIRDAFDVRSFVVQITALAEELTKEPIKVPTGQKRMVKRIQPHITYLTHESEKITHPRKTIMHPQRSYADMLNEVASQLTNLPAYTAQVRITTEAGLAEYTVRTLDPKHQPDKSLYGQALQERLDSIKKQNIQDGYMRSRQEVEEEIRIRQTQCSQPPEDKPPISRRQAR